MRVRVQQIWDDIRSSYWFVPALLGGMAVLASFLTISIDLEYRLEIQRQVSFIWRGSAEGARSLLSTVAGSMITVAGVTFSITIVALTMASQQFGPRILRNFMRDTGNQFVLGAFIGTFTYCLLILRTVHSSDEVEFIPNISVTVAIVLALVSIGVLIYFIHHMAFSIQAPIVIAEVAEDLFEAIDRFFPAGVGLDPAEMPESGDSKEKIRVNQTVPKNFEREAHTIPAPGNGYLQAIDDEHLMAIAIDNDLILDILRRPGHFIVKGNDLVRLWPGEKYTEGLGHEIQRSFILGRQRTNTQDLEFAIDQLVEVAVRAISPAINDPFTAITCIDWLGAALSRLAEKEVPSPKRFDRRGNLRIILEHSFSFEGAIEAAFNQIRQYSRGSAAVRIRMLEAIALISEHTENETYHEALRKQARMIKENIQDALPERKDRQDIGERFKEVIRSQDEP